MRKSIVALSIFVAFMATGAKADDPIRGDALKQLYSGNTVHGHHIKKDFDFLLYFSPDGKATRKRDNGKIHEGKWQLNEDGDMCVDFGKWGGCGQLYKNEDGSYTRKRDGDSLIKIKKFASGKDF